MKFFLSSFGTKTTNFLKNVPSPASFSFIFGLFQTKINTILQKINVKKCPSSIWHWDSNPRHSERESSPITTRPGFPPQTKTNFIHFSNPHYHLSCFYWSPVLVDPNQQQAGLQHAVTIYSYLQTHYPIQCLY